MSAKVYLRLATLPVALHCTLRARCGQGHTMSNALNLLVVPKGKM